MNWLVRRITPQGNSKLVVKLPDVLVDQQPFPAAVDGAPATAVWHRATDTLVVREASGLERLFQLRSGTVARDGGDATARVELELRTPTGMRALSLTVEPHVPGQEGRGAAKARQGLVVRSQITGRVLKVLVAVGDTIEAGQALCIIEAMKMENRVVAAAGGVVAAVGIKEGDAVATGKELVRLAAPGGPA